jgi:hypothetical protein
MLLVWLIGKVLRMVVSCGVPVSEPLALCFQRGGLSAEISSVLQGSSSATWKEALADNPNGLKLKRISALGC